MGGAFPTQKFWEGVYMEMRFYLVRTFRKPGENIRFFYVFHGKFAFFHYNLLGGTLRKPTLEGTMLQDQAEASASSAGRTLVCCNGHALPREPFSFLFGDGGSPSPRQLLWASQDLFLVHLRNCSWNGSSPVTPARQRCDQLLLLALPYLEICSENMCRVTVFLSKPICFGGDAYRLHDSMTWIIDYYCNKKESRLLFPVEVSCSVTKTMHRVLFTSLNIIPQAAG